MPTGSLLFIPTYNCEAQISRVLARVDAKLRGGWEIAEILIVDNGSKDRTFEVALEWSQRCHVPVKVHRNGRNVSLGGSHKLAIHYAAHKGRRHLIVLHGDDQGDPFDLTQSPPKGHLLGARFMGRSRRRGYSRIKTVGNLFFCLLGSVICGRWIFDFGGSGLNVFDVPEILAGRTSSLFMNFPNDLRFHTYLLMSLAHDRQPIFFFPISWREEDQVSNVRAFRQGWKLLGLCENTEGEIAGHVVPGSAR